MTGPEHTSLRSGELQCVLLSSQSPVSTESPDRVRGYGRRLLYCVSHSHHTQSLFLGWKQSGGYWSGKLQRIMDGKISAIEERWGISRPECQMRVDFTDSNAPGKLNQVQYFK